MEINRKIIEVLMVFFSCPILLEPLSFSKIFRDVIEIVFLKTILIKKTLSAKIPIPPIRISKQIINCPNSLQVSTVVWVVNPVSLKAEAAVKTISINEICIPSFCEIGKDNIIEKKIVIIK